MEKQRNKKGSLPIGVRIIGIIIAVLAAAYGLYAGMGNSTGNFDGEMQIFALDVGQGDSFFIISPNGKTMLIDSGESSNSKQIEQFIREKGVRQLDVVIGSHTHSDHVGSMPYLLDAFDVGKYVMSEAGLETRIQKRINAVLEEKDIPEMQHLFRSTVLNVNLRDYTKGEVADWASCGDDLLHWKELLSQHHFIGAFDEQDNMAGFSSMNKEGYLHSMFVHKDMQGRGVATQLLSEVEKMAKAYGVTEITSEISLTAKSFFEQKGYKVVKSQKCRANQLELTNFVMCKRLF